VVFISWLKFSPTLYTNVDSRRFFYVFLIVITAQIVDTTIGNLSDILKDFTVSFWGVALFIGISVAYDDSIHQVGKILHQDLLFHSID
jgi:hypothetical protein